MASLSLVNIGLAQLLATSSASADFNDYLSEDIALDLCRNDDEEEESGGGGASCLRQLYLLGGRLMFLNNVVYGGGTGSIDGWSLAVFQQMNGKPLLRTSFYELPRTHTLLCTPTHTLSYTHTHTLFSYTHPHTPISLSLFPSSLFPLPTHSHSRLVRHPTVEHPAPRMHARHGGRGTAAARPAADGQPA